MSNPYLVQPAPKHHIQVSPTQSLTFWVTGADTENRFTYLEGTLGYLDGPPLHIHSREDEWVYILEGEIRFQIGDEMFDAQAGQMVSLPRNVPHAFTNLQQTPARMLGIVNSDFYTFYAELMDAISQGPAAIKEASTRHGHQTLGPPLSVTLGLVNKAEPA